MEKDELLYHYFSNSLTEEQEVQLKKLLLTDPEFKKQFEFENNLKRATKEKRHQDLKSKLNQFESEIYKEAQVKNASFLYLKIAASIIVLITAGWFGYKSFFSLSYDDLYAENYKIYPNTVYTITRSDTLNSIEREAFIAYEAEDYNLALEKFKSANPREYFDFYVAQSYLRLNDNEKAKALFKTIIEEKKTFYVEANWYLALTYIKEENKEKALYYLKQLIDGHEYKKVEAKKLIQKLR